MDLASLTPLGRSGWSFLGGAGGERVVVGIHPGQGEHAPDVVAALLHLVRGLVPVPEVLEVRPAVPSQGVPGLLVRSWVQGVPGDELLATLDGDPGGQHRLGRAVGDVAASLAAMPQLRSGVFVDADLALADPPGPDTLVQRLAGLGDLLDPPTRRGLLEAADEADELLSGVARRTLVHGDLGPEHVVVDPGSGRVLAVVGWRRAHAGFPSTDLGRAVRHQPPAYVEGVLEAWSARHGTPVEQVLALGRAADLAVLLDQAGDLADAGAAVAALARLGEISRAGLRG